MVAPRVGPAPVVIAHRGACGYRPEHTLASYRLAIELGADFIEPDLVATSDGVLVARHENEIGGTTDIATRPEFADRRTTKVVDGVTRTGWFTEDLTLAEIRTLWATERLPRVRPANTVYDGRLRVPTFEEVLDLAETGGRRRGVTIGVYPETKHPSHFASLGLPLEEPLVAALRRRHLDRPNAPVFVQSFETGNLRRLAERLSVPLVQLVDAAGAPADLVAAGSPTTYADLLTPAGLADVSSYAAAVGVNKSLVLEEPAGSLVRESHRAGLAVHAWTVREENLFLSERFRVGTAPHGRGDAVGETLALLEAGVDGVFCDTADTAVHARDRWLMLQGVTARQPGGRRTGLRSGHGPSPRHRAVRSHG
ncbi:MAG: glycerophosphodiester phosphodiesterase [Nocardioidaceae bacterium]